MNQPKKLAVLINADNVCANTIESILNKIATFGRINIKRVYGDWGSSCLTTWRQKILPNALTPIQQLAYIKGKNVTDVAIIIDAMDLLHSKVFDGFCIVSSDSDFTSLATRIRAGGLLVYGFGDTKTPEIYRNICDQFICMDELNSSTNKNSVSITAEQSKKTEQKQVVQSKAKNNTGLKRQLITLIASIIEAQKNKEGWCNLGCVKQRIIVEKPDFNFKSYGYSKFSSLIASIYLFELKKGSSCLVRIRPELSNSKLILSNMPCAKTKNKEKEKTNTL
ncbi:NYN domain-containing protein [Snodgrassella gandavensis]|uniref:NYN domain-containing protein n=1 Tax=Snodgrassella gandavensis TaxID=2946698 RepID=UPI001EF66383|nr:NYN domain-containing protein [Snodgrassella gandavensis]